MRHNIKVIRTVPVPPPLPPIEKVAIEIDETTARHLVALGWHVGGSHPYVSTFCTELAKALNTTMRDEAAKHLNPNTSHGIYFKE